MGMRKVLPTSSWVYRRASYPFGCNTLIYIDRFNPSHLFIILSATISDQITRIEMFGVSIGAVYGEQKSIIEEREHDKWVISVNQTAECCFF